MVRQDFLPAAKEVADLTFRLLANCQEKEERLASQFSISVPEFRCMRAFRGEHDLLISQIVQTLQVSASRVTRIVESLEQKGFLVRSIDPSDRRSIIATLTPKGVALSDNLENRYIEMHEEILKDIPQQNHEAVVTSLENLLASLTRWLERS
jgi:DNA-binding MarR family transcriptional regulator